MKRFVIVIAALAMGFAMVGCGGGKTPTSSEENLLLKEFDTPFGVPPFEQIKLSHYEPAIDSGIARQNREIEAIVTCEEAPSFENTLVPYTYSGMDLRRVTAVFFNLLSAESNQEMHELAAKISPKLSAHSDNILLNEQLFARVKAVWEGREAVGLQGEDLRLVEETYKSFVRNGANLDEQGKARLMEINQALSKAGLQFGQNLLQETNSMELLLTEESQLSGLPESVIAAGAQSAKEAGKQGWRYTPHKPSLLPFLSYSDNPELREELYKTYYTRGDRGNAQDNKGLIKELVNHRLEKAKLLGYASFADYTLEDRMAKTPQAAMDMLKLLWTPALDAAKAEKAKLEEVMKAEGKQDKLNAADWWYYTEKVRKAEYDLDEEMLRPYLSVDSVREGIFEISRRLYGLTYKPLPDLPVYHPDATAYEVLDHDGSHLAIIYFDFFPRAGKSAGAWCTTYRSQYTTSEGTRVAPVVSIVCNFTPPTGDEPALLLYDDAVTMFHEYGHAIHSFLSDIKYPTLGRVPRDFVELPSQVMEHWAQHSDFIPVYARHYQTGEPMPQELIEKLQKTSHFNMGFITSELTAAALLDMRYHMLTEPLTEDVAEFERNYMKELGLIDEILPRYRSTYFSHVFDGGYSAGYYSYLWSEMLDNDVFQAFVESGDIYNREVATAFRDKVLSRGGTRDALEMFKDFRGREPQVEALLRSRGFKK